MRRLTQTFATVSILLFLIPAAGCRKPRKTQEKVILDDTSGILSVIHASDARAAVQLLRGFHQLENNAWRWTAGEFAVALKPPGAAAKNGARLVLKFTAPETVLAQLKAITISAKVNGTPLPSKTFTQPGEQTYDQEVPAAALDADSVTVTFKLDKFIPASDSDQRDLGVIMTLVGFEAK